MGASGELKVRIVALNRQVVQNRRKKPKYFLKVDLFTKKAREKISAEDGYLLFFKEGRLTILEL